MSVMKKMLMAMGLLLASICVKAGAFNHDLSN
jgi:hypothetical protein